MIKWIKWEDQNELANLVKYYIDKGSHRKLIIKEILAEKQKRKYNEKQIDKKISELKKKWLIIENEGHVQVTEWSHDAIMEAMNDTNFTSCLKKLKKLRIFHPQMVEDGIVAKEEV